MVHLIHVVNVHQGLYGFYKNREANGRQKNTTEQHGQDIDAGPSEGVLQFLLFRFRRLRLGHFLTTFGIRRG